jgi:hypothetical protein
MRPGFIRRAERGLFDLVETAEAAWASMVRRDELYLT